MSLLVENAPLGALKPCAKNARTHTKKQVAAIARSIRELGFNNPILVDANFEIIAGHARAKAAEQLKLESVPVIKLGNLSEQQKRAYRLADNRLAEILPLDPNSRHLVHLLRIADLRGSLSVAH